MQTFLPYPEFKKSAACLDNKRLGKQRVEAKQIFKALTTGPGAPWYNHPAVQMWKGYTEALLAYYDAIVKEWIRRGFKNRMPLYGIDCYVSPPWLGDYRFHSSHRSNLLRKDPIHYMIFGWEEPDNLPYLWPGDCLTESSARAGIYLLLKSLKK